MQRNIRTTQSTFTNTSAIFSLESFQERHPNINIRKIVRMPTSRSNFLYSPLLLEAFITFPINTQALYTPVPSRLVQSTELQSCIEKHLWSMCPVQRIWYDAEDQIALLSHCC